MKKYYIYRNLHKNCFSVTLDGLVVRHSRTILAQGVTFKVSEKGRQRVLETKRKNVHAKVGCTRIILFPDLNSFDILGEVYYNPYTTSKFMYNNTEIDKSDWVLLQNNKIYLLQKK